MAYQVGIDVGGTFTDLVVGDGSGSIFKTKTPSIPGDESAGILTGLTDAAGEYDKDLAGFLGETDVLVLGTTAVTNAMLEYDGANTGLITTGGFRDIIEIRRSYREHLFDIRLPPPHAIVPRQ